MPTRLFLDFGTAYCKAATCKRGEPPVPLAIGDAVRQGRMGDPHMIRTALFISQSGKVYFGEAAVDRAAAEERQPYDAIKDVLTDADQRSELDDALPDNPTEVPLTKRHAFTIFLAFFTQAALQARGGPKREVRRSIAMPVFEKEKQQWVSKELAKGLARAHVLAGHFGDDLFGSVDLGEAVRVLSEANRPQVVADPPTVAEPVAAFAGHLLHFTPQGTSAPFLTMVVDVGAGTTDIAMFVGGGPEGIVNVGHVAGSKVSLPCAGKAIDQALIDHLVSKDGSLRDALEREGNGQPIKEDLFERGQVTRSGISSSLQNFLQSEPMLRVISEIRCGFGSVLHNVDPSFFLRKVAVRFSGGGHDLPFLEDLVEKEQYLGGLGGTRIRMEKARSNPGWRDQPRYSDLNDEIGHKFHRMAVALGGAYYCADSRTWLRLEDDRSSLGAM